MNTPELPSIDTKEHIKKHNVQLWELEKYGKTLSFWYALLSYHNYIERFGYNNRNWGVKHRGATN